MDYSDIQGLLDGLRPVSRITVSEWADKYRYLSPISSAEPGKYRTDRTPYMRKIMDCLSYTESYKRIVFMKSAQTGGSEAAINFIGYVIHINPAPIMMVQPNEDMYRKVSKGRIDPLIEMCPELKNRVSEKKSRDSSNTVNQKNFSGGVLYLTGANSAAGLRSVPVRFLILDEVDSYSSNLNNEGSPIELAIARTETFSNKKIFIISTPTIAGMSAIESEFAETDQHYYHVPCPHCGEKQRLIWEQLQWEDGRPETVRYYCIHCGTGIEEIHKEEMLTQGEWRPEKPELSNPDVIGFHINALYSPVGLGSSWKELAGLFLKVQKNQDKLRTFINTKLGETWVEQGEAPPYKNLYNRRENYSLNVIPDDVCFLTCGVDTQDNRLELEIVGWCADKRSYSIDYRVFEGDPAKAEVWNKLSGVVNECWQRSDGEEFYIRMMAIDSGGHKTSHVYDFCKRFSPNRVRAIKGMDNLNMPFSSPKQTNITKSGKKIGKKGVWGVGVSFLKSELYSYLRLEKDSEGNPPPGYCHFPEYPEHYFRGLTAEELVSKIVKGYTRYEWKKVYERNEPLDCRIYARAAAAMEGFDRMSKEQIQAMVNPLKRKQASNENEDIPLTNKKRRKRSDFWDR
ncbi:MAG: phage terminase large subunit family protein [Dysgonamonadaceae bacterium]|jgi:phage terminase large subunit GpA-like protein|nr:phage terminase large subunit family protein [Dysgonamonadaceae bacterium]